MIKYIGTIFLILALSGCDAFDEFFSHADQKFGKQHFISAVAHIELHKTRNGSYPRSLKDLEFLGDWDLIWLPHVEYQKLSNGYNLYINRGYASEPELSLPAAFFKGLGLKNTNVNRES